VVEQTAPPFGHTLWFSRLHNELERSTMLFMGKSTFSMVIFHSYVKLPEGTLSHPFLITLGLQLSMKTPSFRMEFPEIQLKTLDWLSREKLISPETHGLFTFFIHIP
jgi:hypothetical protein